MSLPKIAPLAVLVAGVAVAVDQQQKNQASLKQVSDQAKSDLDKLTSELGGDVGSALNQASGDLNSALAAADAAFNVDGAVSKIGDGVNAVTSAVGGNSISNFADDVGTAFGAAQNGLNAVAGTTAEISSTISKLGIGGNLASGFQDFAANVGKAAGVLNNLLSLKRGANLPAGGELFEFSEGAGVKLSPQNPNDWRVKINANFDHFGANPLFEILKDTGGVVFPYLPEITFSTTANYSQIDPVHNNYPFQAYKNSQVDEINISGDFTAESSSQAAYWIAATTFFKTSTKMFFGTGDLAGNPPIICRLYGYGANVFDGVPVVIKNFSVTLPTDVDYIRCTEASQGSRPTWVPRKSNINITAQPIYNRESLRKFSLEQYAKGQTGTMGGFI